MKIDTAAEMGKTAKWVVFAGGGNWICGDALPAKNIPDRAGAKA